MTRNASSSEAAWKLDGTTLSVRIPLRFQRRGGRKVVVAPDGGEPLGASAFPLPNETLLRALGRAHRWKRLLEDGTYGTIAEIAEAEKISISYISRVLQLVHLAPEVVEQILDGCFSQGISLGDLLGGFSIGWDEQHAWLKRLNHLF